MRSTERGELEEEFAARYVWTIQEGKAVREWLVIRRGNDGSCSYSLSNAPWLKCMRYFVERAIQDAKSEDGWDDFQVVYSYYHPVSFNSTIL